VVLGFEKVLSKKESSWLETASVNSLEMSSFLESIDVRLMVLSLWLRKEDWKDLSCSYTALAQRLGQDWDIKEFKFPEVGDGGDMMRIHETFVQFLARKYPKAKVRMNVK
jgi:hypothetical protein